MWMILEIDDEKLKKELDQLVGFGSIKQRMVIREMRQWEDHDLNEVEHAEFDVSKSDSRAHVTIG